MEGIAIGEALKKLQLKDVALLILAVGVLLIGIGVYQYEDWPDTTILTVDQPIESPDVTVTVPADNITILVEIPDFPPKNK